MATKSADTDDEFDFEIEAEDAGSEDNKPAIEVEDDTPEEDRGREPMPKEIVEELDSDDLEEYSEKVKLRLKQMRKVYHDERREKERALREQNEALAAAQRYRQEVEVLRSTLAQGEEQLVGTTKEAASLELDAARRMYREAYEAGDTDKVIEAQEKLSNAQHKLRRVEEYKPTLQRTGTEVEATEQSVRIPEPDAKTKAWQERNTWWGTDPEMTASALGLHQKLERERGPQFVGSDEYWGAIDTTMRRRFPEYYGEENKTTPAKGREPKANVVAPASRSTSPKKIVLKQSQLSIAKKLGLTPEQYARELMKMDR